MELYLRKAKQMIGKFESVDIDWIWIGLKDVLKDVII